MTAEGKRKPSNQELRTRKDLLLAAGRLTEQGRKPTMDEVAKEALVSRATAYRYFRSIDVLLAELPLDVAVGDPATIFTNEESDDPEERIEKAEAFVHETVYRHEAQVRILLASSIGRDMADATLPGRQNRRLPLIEAALATARPRLRDADYRRLCSALSLIIGPESMIVFRDVIHLNEDTARAVKSWAVKALVRATLEDSRSRGTRRRAHTDS